MEKRILGIDFGDIRVGVAIADELGFLAHPYETIQSKNSNVKSRNRHCDCLVARINEIIQKESIGKIIIGIPKSMSGEEGPAAQKVRVFVEKLKGKIPADCEIKLIDERLTTVAAQKALHASGRNIKNSRPIIDQVAAQLILQTYLDGESLKREMEEQ